MYQSAPPTGCSVPLSGILKPEYAAGCQRYHAVVISVFLHWDSWRYYSAAGTFAYENTHFSSALSDYFVIRLVVAFIITPAR